MPTQLFVRRCTKLIVAAALGATACSKSKGSSSAGAAASTAPVTDTSVATTAATPGATTVVVGTGAAVQASTTWTWVTGGSQGTAPGVCGTNGGTAAITPGARQAASGWGGPSGTLWLFGGLGVDCKGVHGVSLNDLWKFDGTSWNMESGNIAGNAPGTYGIKGLAAADNSPGGRAGAITWTDAKGKMWLFGGSGVASAGGNGLLNDLWSYDGSVWTWVGGSDAANQTGIYGTLATATAESTPGARQQSAAWADQAGNLWLFGGAGKDSAGTSDYLNDLWKYDGAGWTWMAGGDKVNNFGDYGTKGTGAAANIPGARIGATVWTDKTNNVWLFGGFGYDNGGTRGFLADLWKFDGKLWTWVAGPETIDVAGTYGTKGTGAAANYPGARAGASSWYDASGNLWLFGGACHDTANANIDDGIVGSISLNDLWKFDGTTWTWVAGADTIGQFGTYGTVGVGSATTMPGGRTASASWLGSAGELWLFGGIGLDTSDSSASQLNDLWKFQP